MKQDPAVEAVLAESAQVGVPLDEAQASLLAGFEALLVERAVPLGFVSESDADRIRERHVLDSLRAAAAVVPSDRTAVDFGSGAGLPGIPVAIARPSLALTLSEVRPKRAAFLELVVERLGLSNVAVTTTRVEDLRGPFDLCFARAYAALDVCWTQAQPLLAPGGRLVYFAGRGGEPVLTGTVVRLLAPVLASGGPLAIISRQ